MIFLMLIWLIKQVITLTIYLLYINTNVGNIYIIKSRFKKN